MYNLPTHSVEPPLLVAAILQVFALFLKKPEVNDRQFGEHPIWASSTGHLSKQFSRKKLHPTGRC